MLRRGFAAAAVVAATGCGGAMQSPSTPPPAPAPPAASAPAAPSEAPVVRPGAPGTPDRPAPATGRPAGARFTDADVKFMQGMIGHHQQALEMTALLADRTMREDMKLLAKRIDVSQTDEIRMMKRWLEERGQTVPTGHEHHMGGAMMPGMLSADQMAALAAAKGAEFDRLFLTGMIQHHEGAIIMVRELFAQAGAAQDPDIFAFASDVEADQLIEIRRMRSMLTGGGGALQR
jgi:uncharacterized protein (DUF305 family)